MARQIPLTCSGHTRPVVHLSFSDITPYGYFLISACKGKTPYFCIFHRPAFAPVTFCPKKIHHYMNLVPRFWGDTLNRLTDEQMRYIRCRRKKNGAILWGKRSWSGEVNSLGSVVVSLLTRRKLEIRVAQTLAKLSVDRNTQVKPWPVGSGPWGWG